MSKNFGFSILNCLLCNQSKHFFYVRGKFDQNETVLNFFNDADARLEDLSNFSK